MIENKADLRGLVALELEKVIKDMDCFLDGERDILFGWKCALSWVLDL